METRSIPVPKPDDDQHLFEVKFLVMAPAGTDPEKILGKASELVAKLMPVVVGVDWGHIGGS